MNTEQERALLAERDDLLENGKQAVRWAPSSAHWSNELKRLFGDDAREGIDALEARLRAAQAERDALLEALTEVLRINETDAGNDVKAWANAMLNAHAAIAKATGEKMP